MKVPSIAAVVVLSGAQLFAAPATTPAAPPAAATLADAQLTLADVDAQAGAQLLHAQQQVYDLRREAAKELLFTRALEAEAKKQNIPAADLLQKEVNAKAGAPSEADIQNTFNQYRSQLPPDEAQAKKMVRDALVERNVQMRRHAYRTELLAASKAKIAIPPVRFPVQTNAADASFGPASAPVTIVEFSDFQCPYCAQSQSTVAELKKKYGDKVRLVFKHLPLDIHPQAKLAAQAASCAGDQGGKFWPMHDWLFANYRTIDRESILRAAGEQKLDVAELTKCLDEGRHAAHVEADMAEAARLGINGTPAFLVNGRLFSGAVPLDMFSEIIDEELASAK